PYGAPFDEVKSAYRKLMRKYHPDLHNQSPKKQKAATELSMQVTQAYNALEKWLDKKGDPAPQKIRHGKGDLMEPHEAGEFWRPAWEIDRPRGGDDRGDP